MSAIMGLNRWCSPLKLWAIKTGVLVEPDLSDVEAVEIGSDLESYVAEKFAKKTGFTVRREPKEFRHPKYSYIYGHIDRRVLNEDAILECKTTGAWRAKEWRDEEMPHEYVIQVNGYLGLTRKTTGYVACLIAGQRFSWKQITFDQDLFDKMVAAAKDFWENNVGKNIAPMATEADNEMLGQLFRESKVDTIKFDEKNAQRIDSLVEERQGGIEQKKLVETELDRIEAQLKQALGESTDGETGQYHISWRPQIRQGVDTQKLKDDGLFDKYAKSTQFRVLRTSLKGE